MALIKVDFFSQSLMRTVSIQAILPVDKILNPGEELPVQKPFKTLYLLHGIYGNDTDWISGTRIQRWAQDYNLAVIMPAGENKFYVDNERSHDYYSRFIGQELVDMTRRLFPLSEKREDTFIAGLSMGGYGAIINGLRYHETFGYIAGLSSALILDMVIQAQDGENIPYMFKRRYLESVFGPIEKIKGSNKDYKALIENIQQKDVPQIYLACGTEDPLLKKNREYYQFLKEHQIPVTFKEGKGGHEWDFWDHYILDVLKWLPLNEKQEGMSSGHVL